MRQFSETELTAAVISSFDDTPDPRAKFLLQELVKSLHDYVRRTDLTFEEWEYAIDFLTRTGQKCTPIRQEFILLSDVLGVSMLVDAVNYREREGATETTVLGPFYVGEHKVTPHGTDISASLPGERMFVQSRVTDLQGKPLAGVPVDVWHADDDGFYDSQKPAYATEGPSSRARFMTDGDGRFFFRTILPCSYPIPTDGPVGEMILQTRRHPAGVGRPAGQRRIGVKHVDRGIEPFALARNRRREAKWLRRITLLLDHCQRNHRPVEQHRDRRAGLHIRRAISGNHLANL